MIQKSFIAVLCLCLLPLCASAQTERKTFKKGFSAGKQKIVLVLDRSDIEIIGTAGNEVEISTAGDVELKPPPERAKGLKPLHNGATDNTGIGLDVQESGGVMTIKKAIGRNIGYTLKVPNGADINVKQLTWHQNEFKFKDLSGELEVEGLGSSLVIHNVTGPIVANTTNGSIEVVFTKINQSKPTHIAAINGHVDVSLPSDTKANVELSTTNGEVFTDFDIKLDEEGDSGSEHVSHTLGTINGGGVELSFHSINNHVYLRKK